MYKSREYMDILDFKRNFDSNVIVLNCSEGTPVLFLLC